MQEHWFCYFAFKDQLVQNMALMFFNKINFDVVLRVGRIIESQ